MFQVPEQDFSLIIYGASGSLAKLKIFPAIYQLAMEGRLANVDYRVIGFARSEMSNEEFRSLFRQSVVEALKDIDEGVMTALLQNVYYLAGDYADRQSFLRLNELLVQIEPDQKRVRIAYFSVPPSVFPDIVRNGADLFDTDAGLMRLVLEKPFGYDLASAQELERLLMEFYQEEQLYLLDHYLGKEAVFNVLSLRYANAILTTLIKGSHVLNIQITGFEPLGIEGRASYFDNVGICRDMIQSHLFQILAFLTMSLPAEINMDSVRRGKRHVFEDLKIVDLKDSVARGQYEAGLIAGEKVPGYLEEQGVPKESKTETFTALKLYIDNLQWHGVPIYLRSGKRMKAKSTAIVIEFKQHELQRGSFAELETNKLVIQLQPNEMIEFKLFTKMGGTEIAFSELNTGRPIYCSGDCLHEHGRLLLEAIRGNRLLFLSFEEIYAAWRVIDPVITAFKENIVPLEKYMAGTTGPKGADDLLARDGYCWHDYF
jgi:glucose-6-phosphate 1-dehydrogenase